MTNDIWWALSPILTLSRFCGLFVFDYPSGKPNVFLSVLYTSSLWLTYRCIVYCGLFVTNFQFLKGRLNSVLYCFNEFIILVTIIRNIYYDEKFRRCLKRIDFVDDSLQKIGVPKEYSKLRKYVWLIITLWCATVMALNAPNVVWMFINPPELMLGFFAAIVISVSFHLSMITDSIFWIILRYMGKRFDQLNECILKISNDQMHEDYPIQKTLLFYRRNPYINEKKRRQIWTAMHLHLEMCNIVREMDTIFGIQISLGLCISFLFLPFFFIEVFSFYSYYKDLVWLKAVYTATLSSWTVVYILRIYIMNYLCENVSAKGNAIRDIIHVLKDYTKQGDTRKEIMQFVLRIVHKPLEFSGGFFKFGYVTLHKFISFALTVVTIILQMNSSQIKSNSYVFEVIDTGMAYSLRRQNFNTFAKDEREYHKFFASKNKT